MTFRLEKHFPLFTAFLWGTTYVATKNALSGFSPMVIAAGRAFFAYMALILILLSIFTGNSLALWRGTGLALASVVWLGLICSATASLLLVTALEKTRAASATVFLFICPVIAAISAYFLLKEKIGLDTVVGGLFIIGGILISVLAKPDGLSDQQVADHTLSE